MWDTEVTHLTVISWQADGLNIVSNPTQPIAALSNDKVVYLNTSALSHIPAIPMLLTLSYYFFFFLSP